MGSMSAVSPGIAKPDPPPQLNWAPLASERPLKVLLVEDNQEHADWATLLLSSDSNGTIRVEWVRSLVEAMTRLSDASIDVIVLDLGLPELTGYRSHAAMQVVAPGVPIVILTGDDSPVSRDLALSRNASDYLVKSEVTSERLRGAVWRAFDSRGKRF